MPVLELPFSLPEDLSGHPGLTIVATPDVATASVALIVEGIHTSATYITIVRNDPDGATRTVRSAGHLLTGGATIVALSDFEAPLRGTVTYTVTPDFGYPVSSDPVTLETPLDEHWLKNVAQVAQSVRIEVADMSSVRRPARALARYDVLGRANPVIISDVRGGRTGTMVLTTYDANDAAALRSLFTTGYPLLFQAPYEMDFADLFFVASDVEERRLTYGTSPMRQFTVPWAEVDAPAGDLITGVNSWAQVAQFGTWQNVMDKRGTWLDVLNLPYNTGDEG